jgi:hypothetical protein
MALSDNPVLNLATFDDDFQLDPPSEAVAELPAQLQAQGQCHRRDLQSALGTADIPVDDRWALVTAVADAVDHVVQIERESRYRNRRLVGSTLTGSI